MYNISLSKTETFFAVVIIIVIIWGFIKYFIVETMDTVTPVLSMYTGIDKLVNLKATVDGKEYFLATIPKTFCEGISDGADECAHNILVLLESDDIDPKYKIYQDALTSEINKCNTDTKNQCDKLNLTAETKKDCPSAYDDCKKPLKFVNDFSIKEITRGTVKTYKLYSNPLTYSTTNPLQYLVGQLSGPFDKTVMCADSPISVDGIIVEANIEPDFKVSFNKQQFSGTSMLFEPNGDPRVTKMYVGKSTDDLCKMGSKNIIRLKLYENINDPNVLQLKPILK